MRRGSGGRAVDAAERQISQDRAPSRVFRFHRTARDTTPPLGNRQLVSPRRRRRAFVDFEPRKTDERVLTVARLAEGWSVESKYVTDLRRVEATIRESCEEFKGLLFVMESYGGQEEIEY